MFGNNVIDFAELDKHTEKLKTERETFSEDGHLLALWDDENGGELQDSSRLLRESRGCWDRLGSPKCSLVLRGYLREYLRDTANNGDTLPRFSNYEEGSESYWEKLAAYRSDDFYRVQVDNMIYHVIGHE
jgi:hypothetical protein